MNEDREAKSKGQRAKGKEQRAKSKGQRAKGKEQIGWRIDPLSSIFNLRSSILDLLTP
jgi:hypothetical protein